MSRHGYFRVTSHSHNDAKNVIFGTTVVYCIADRQNFGELQTLYRLMNFNLASLHAAALLSMCIVNQNDWFNNINGE